MAQTKTIRVQLDYPLDQVREPILYHLVKDYNLIPNIRRAQIDVRTGGMMILQLEGTPDDLEASMAFLRTMGISVMELNQEWAWTI
jgi:L-aspartate semialdehyde sulfurtransferase ferredoxin